MFSSLLKDHKIVLLFWICSFITGIVNYSWVDIMFYGSYLAYKIWLIRQTEPLFERLIPIFMLDPMLKTAKELDHVDATGPSPASMNRALTIAILLANTVLLVPSWVSSILMNFNKYTLWHEYVLAGATVYILLVVSIRFLWIGLYARDKDVFPKNLSLKQFIWWMVSPKIESFSN